MEDIIKYVLIVAGGSGVRLSPEIPKQFLLIRDKPIILRTFDPFIEYDPTCRFIIVLPKDHIRSFKTLCERYSLKHPCTIAEGGSTRFESVKNGLKKIETDGIVFIHDGVRPLVSTQTIRNCYEGTLKNGNAIPVISPAESIRERIDGTSRSVDRSKYFLVQTPQTFRVDQIKDAYNQNYQKHFTDDASVLENMGYNVNMVEGNRENIKITYPEDVTVANAFYYNFPK